MQDDHSETPSEGSEHMCASPHISSYEKVRELKRESDGGHKRYIGQSFRNLSKIRGKRSFSVGRYRNKPGGRWQSRGSNKAKNKSQYGKETAGSKNAGRSGTIQVGNMTEVAFWPMQGERDPALGYLQSLYDGDHVSLVVADSTPNGPNGWFYRTWVQDNEWAKIFAAWFEFEDSVVPFKSETSFRISRTL